MGYKYEVWYRSVKCKGAGHTKEHRQGIKKLRLKWMLGFSRWLLIENNGNCISEKHEVGTVGIESLEVLATIQIHVWTLRVTSLQRQPHIHRHPIIKKATLLPYSAVRLCCSGVEVFTLLLGQIKWRDRCCWKKGRWGLKVLVKVTSSSVTRESKRFLQVEFSLYSKQTLG